MANQNYDRLSSVRKDIQTKTRTRAAGETGNRILHRIVRFQHENRSIQHANWQNGTHNPAKRTAQTLTTILTTEKNKVEQVLLVEKHSKTILNSP
jgi:negative regulator of replication initiation